VGFVSSSYSYTNKRHMYYMYKRKQWLSLSNITNVCLDIKKEIGLSSKILFWLIKEGNTATDLKNKTVV
jgi:hypothetical protein